MPRVTSIYELLNFPTRLVENIADNVIFLFGKNRVLKNFFIKKHIFEGPGMKGFFWDSPIRDCVFCWFFPQ